MSQIVTGGPDGEVCTTLRVCDGHLTMSAGDDADAEVTVRLSWDDAVAMAAGELATTDASAAGRVRIRPGRPVRAGAVPGHAGIGVLPARRSARRHVVLTRGAPGCTGGPRTKVGR